MGMDQADLTFVGGGVSCVAVLEELVARSLAEPRIWQGGAATGRPLRVLIVDRGGEFGGGVPYGRSVPPGCLCNDPVLMQHPAEFAAWLHEHRERWLRRLRAGRDPVVRRWLAFNTECLAGAQYAPSDFDALFVPRLIYGDFVREKLNVALTTANASRALEVVLVRGRAIGIKRSGQSFQLDLEGGGGVMSSGRRSRNRQPAAAAGARARRQARVSQRAMHQRSTEAEIPSIARG